MSLLVIAAFRQAAEGGASKTVSREASVQTGSDVVLLCEPIDRGPDRGLRLVSVV